MSQTRIMTIHSLLMRLLSAFCGGKALNGNVKHFVLTWPVTTHVTPGSNFSTSPGRSRPGLKSRAKISSLSKWSPSENDANFTGRMRFLLKRRPHVTNGDLTYRFGAYSWCAISVQRGAFTSWRCLQRPGQDTMSPCKYNSALTYTYSALMRSASCTVGAFGTMGAISCTQVFHGMTQYPSIGIRYTFYHVAGIRAHIRGNGGGGAHSLKSTCIG